jgi:hypothetical protein
MVSTTTTSRRLRLRPIDNSLVDPSVIRQSIYASAHAYLRSLVTNKELSCIFIYFCVDHIDQIVLPSASIHSVRSIFTQFTTVDF